MSPLYDYVCEAGHLQSEFHRTDESPVIVCKECGDKMRKRISMPNVNWNGLKPSGGEIHPNIQKLIDTAPERREKFAERHEKHERETEHEH